MPAPEHDEILKRLRAARPELDDALLSTEAPAAQTLMDAIVDTPSDHDTPLRSRRAVLRSQQRGRRLAAVVAGAAAVAIGAGVVAVTRPGSDSPTASGPKSTSTTSRSIVLANIRTIAERSGTALGATGRARITFDSDGRSKGTTDLSFSGHDIAMTIRFAGADGRPGFDTTNKTVSGEFYLYTPGPDNVTRWYHDTNSGGSSVFDTDPRTLLAALVPETGFVTAGDDTVDGVAVTHLRATKLDTLPSLNLSLGPIDARDAKTLDLWIDSHDVVRRLDLTTERNAQELDPKTAPLLQKKADGTITIIKKDGSSEAVDVRNLDEALKAYPHVTKTYRSTYSVVFFDIGAPISITAPADATDIAAKG